MASLLSFRKTEKFLVDAGGNSAVASHVRRDSVILQLQACAAIPEPCFISAEVEQRPESSSSSFLSTSVDSFNERANKVAAGIDSEKN